MIIADDTAAEIDLKCEEKVTDSDVEESNFDSEDNQTNKVHVCLSLLSVLTHCPHSPPQLTPNTIS